MIEYHTGSDLPSTKLPFSPATQLGSLIFISGQASTDASGTIVPDTFEGEFRRTMENVRRLLQASGGDLDSVLQVRAYLRKASDWEEYNKLYREYFSEPFPARTTLTGCLPETILFEIDCIAASKKVE